MAEHTTYLTGYIHIMIQDEIIRNSEAFSHHRIIGIGGVFNGNFAHDGERSVRLTIQGQILNVSERVETIPVNIGSMRTFQRSHTLTVFGLNPEQESITRTDVITALREYDEAIYRLIAAPNVRVRCSLNPEPRRSS